MGLKSWWANRGPIAAEPPQGITCDTPWCTFAAPEVTRAEYPAWRNKPCPSCGGNLFTDADWKALRRIEIIIAIFNTMFFFLPRPAPGSKAGGTFHFDGTGAPDLRRHHD